MRSTKFGPQPAKMILRSRGISIAQAALDIRVKQAHLQSCLDGNICPNDDVRRELPKYLERPLEELFGAIVLNWTDQRGRGLMPITCISDTDWWDHGHVQAARDVIVNMARREARMHGGEIEKTEPEREVLSHDPAIWRFTWKVVKGS